MTQIGYDNFTRADVAGGWGTATDGSTYNHSNGVGTMALTSNVATLTNDNSSNLFKMTGNPTSIGDAAFLMKTAVSALSAGAGIFARGPSVGNGYRCRIANGQLQLAKMISGTATLLTAAVAIPSYSIANQYWLLFEMYGSNLRAH